MLRINQKTMEISWGHANLIRWLLKFLCLTAMKHLRLLQVEPSAVTLHCYEIISDIFIKIKSVLIGSLGSSVEFQALLAEIKQKDKQREELLMKLKVCVPVDMFLFSTSLVVHLQTSSHFPDRSTIARVNCKKYFIYLAYYIL